MKSTRNTFRTVMSIVLIVSMFMSLGIMTAFAEGFKGNLECNYEEHTHSEACYMKLVLGCGLSEDEHEHTDACYGPTCGREEHIHTDECLYYICNCEQEGLEHTDECRMAPGCEKEEHSHEECPIGLICGHVPHTHSNACYSDCMICGKEAHKHTQDNCYTIPEDKTYPYVDEKGNPIDKDEEGNPIELKFVVTYDYTIEGATSGAIIVSEDAVKVGDTVNVKGYSPMGSYTFSGWQSEDVDVSGGAFVMPSHDVRITGVYIPFNEFIVTTYEQTLDGGYAATKQDIIATPDADAAISAKKTDIPGFSFIKSELKGNVIELYYDRLVNTVTYMVDGNQYGKVENHMYGETITLSDPEKKDYDFSGWSSDELGEVAEFKMPAAPVVLKGSFSAKDGVDVTVITYRQNGQGKPVEYSKKTISGKVGTYTKVTAPAVDGYELQPIIQQLIKAEGTVVNVFYDKVDASYSVITYLETSKGVYGEGSVLRMTGKIGSMTKAVAGEISNYVLTRNVQQQEIKADDSTVIELYYDRLTPFPAAVNTTLRTDTTKAPAVIVNEAGAEAAAEAGTIDIEDIQLEVVEPAGTVEIADEETPLASGVENQQGFNYWYILLGAVILVGAWWIILLFKRRKDEEEAQA